MYLASVTQRDELFRVATNWFRDRPEPGDARFVTEVFVFESVIWAPTLRGFLTDILARTQVGRVSLRRLRSKDELRAALCTAYGDLSDRGRDLCRQHALHPEEFFPGTPADLVLASRGDGRPVAMMRIKRVRRIAEKASRRVADCLAHQLHDAARQLAAERAAAAGVSLEHFVSSPEAMLEDFARAEWSVSREFRDGAPTFSPRDLRVDDVLGVKFVGTPEELTAIERAIVEHPGVAALEREEHRGRYNDVNLLVDLSLPPPGVTVDRARSLDWSFAAGRGIPPEELAQSFPRYVETGAPTVRVEVILTTPEELMESEFGRSIHEQRILEQRRSAAYSGRIASNASFLIEYLLMTAISPTVELGELPVKMWGRYLPDTYSLAVWELFGTRIGLEVVHAFADAPNPLLPPRAP